MSANEIARELVESIIHTEMDHWGRVSNTEAFKSGQVVWGRYSASVSDTNALRQEILSYYNGLETNSKGINLQQVEARGFFSKILTALLKIPVRLDYYDVSGLGEAIVGFILSVIFFGSNAAARNIQDQLEQYKENNVDADILAKFINSHFQTSIVHLNGNQINVIKQANILNETNNIFYRTFKKHLQLKLIEQAVAEPDNAMKQLAERLSRF
jgi:hypothetical protein